MLSRSVLALLGIFACTSPALAADAAAGKAYFTQVCNQCHIADPNEGGGEMGPMLIGVLGKQAATADKEFPYSQALKDSKLVWNMETLDRFLANPPVTVPGTTMPMPIPAKQDRDNVIAYLGSLAAK